MKRKRLKTAISKEGRSLYPRKVPEVEQEIRRLKAIIKACNDQIVELEEWLRQGRKKND
jgi:hypothetical protein